MAADTAMPTHTTLDTDMSTDTDTNAATDTYAPVYLYLLGCYDCQPCVLGNAICYVLRALCAQSSCT